ncbi:MAG: flagellin lysine-N-methylase [Clostridia bacterium]|nr:flagellin lysine-N-methylase [Clostridia bacterium]
MEEEYLYFVPDYLKDFKCKMGACRHACCSGWQVSVPMDTYFKLLGMPCDEALRRRLDVGLRMLDRPTPEEYAFFNPRYDGECPMRMEDGRCIIHAQVGEESLPDVCRLYPRGIRLEAEGYECSLANSCEKTLELFLHRSEPLTFLSRRLPLAPPPLPGRSLHFGLEGLHRPLRLHYITLLQERRISLPHRLILLGFEIMKTEEAAKAGDHAAIGRQLSASSSSLYREMPKEGEGDLLYGMEIMERLVDGLDRHSVSVKDAGQYALDYFRAGDLMERYGKALARFEEHLPDWEIFFEHILVNHLFFSLFPFQDRPESFKDEYLSFCAIYALMRFLCLGCLAGEYTEERLIDLLAAAFRLIDHTNFERYAGKLLRAYGCEVEDVHKLILL